MSNIVFNARFTPQICDTLGADTFEVTADVFDGTGQFSGFDVAVDDVVFLDTYNSITAPSSISRYVVQSITSSGAFSVVAVLKYEDSGTPVDPNEILGNPGFICRASVKGFGYHAAPTLHTFPDYITQYARDYDNYIKLDENLTDIDTSALKGRFINGSGGTLTALKLVRQNTAGNIFSVDPSDESQVLRILGVLSDSTDDAVSGVVIFSGRLLNISTSFAVGDVLFLSKSGGYTVTAPEIGVGGFLAGDWIVRVGQITKNEDNPSNKDFKVELDIVGVL